MANITVYSSFDELQLRSILDLLLQNGVPAMLTGNLGTVNIILPQVTSEGEIVIDEADAERALELISGFEGTLGELAELEPEDEDHLS